MRKKNARSKGGSEVGHRRFRFHKKTATLCSVREKLLSVWGKKKICTYTVHVRTYELSFCRLVELLLTRRVVGGRQVRRKVCVRTCLISECATRKTKGDRAQKPERRLHHAHVNLQPDVCAKVQPKYLPTDDEEGDHERQTHAPFFH